MYTRTEYFLQKVLTMRSSLYKKMCFTMLCKSYFTNIQCTSFLFVAKYITFSLCTFSCIMCLFASFVQTYWPIKLCRNWCSVVPLRPDDHNSMLRISAVMRSILVAGASDCQGQNRNGTIQASSDTEI